MRLYAGVLDERLMVFAGERNSRAVSQIGFRPEVLAVLHIVHVCLTYIALHFGGSISPGSLACVLPWFNRFIRESAAASD